MKFQTYGCTDVYLTLRFNIICTVHLHKVFHSGTILDSNNMFLCKCCPFLSFIFEVWFKMIWIMQKICMHKKKHYTTHKSRTKKNTESIYFFSLPSSFQTISTNGFNSNGYYYHIWLRVANLIAENFDNFHIQNGLFQNYKKNFFFF